MSKILWMMNNLNPEEIVKKAKLVIKKYQKDFPDVKMDRDYIPFKVTEEWGECLQAYLMFTDRGRQKGKTKKEIKEMFSEEFADVFTWLLLFAEAEGIDLAKAIDEKWFSHLVEKKTDGKNDGKNGGKK